MPYIQAKQPGGAGDSEKTLTNLLLERDGSFSCFGHGARTACFNEEGRA